MNLDRISSSFIHLQERAKTSTNSKASIVATSIPIQRERERDFWSLFVVCTARLSGRMKKGDQNLEAPFHVIHKLPAGDSPYVRAKHVQVFWRNEHIQVGISFIDQVHITNYKDHNSVRFSFDVSFHSITILWYECVFNCLDWVYAGFGVGLVSPKYE